MLLRQLMDTQYSANPTVKHVYIYIYHIWICLNIKYIYGLIKKTLIIEENKLRSLLNIIRTSVRPFMGFEVRTLSVDLVAGGELAAVDATTRVGAVCWRLEPCWGRCQCCWWYRCWYRYQYWYWCRQATHRSRTGRLFRSVCIGKIA